VLRSEDDMLADYQNQTTYNVKKIGIRRLRTMELLKNIFTLISKHDEINEVKKMKEQNYNLMKKRIIETMLYMIKTYPFCSISN